MLDVSLISELGNEAFAVLSMPSEGDMQRKLGRATFEHARNSTHTSAGFAISGTEAYVWLQKIILVVQHVGA